MHCATYCDHDNICVERVVQRILNYFLRELDTFEDDGILCMQTCGGAHQCYDINKYM